jgi:L-rhamnose mutarotase
MDELKTYCLVLDLKNNESLINEYEHYHKPGNVWPEIIEGIKACGVQSMKIFRLGTRLVMILQTVPEFDLDKNFHTPASTGMGSTDATIPGEDPICQTR